MVTKTKKRGFSIGKTAGRILNITYPTALLGMLYIIIRAVLTNCGVLSIDPYVLAAESSRVIIAAAIMLIGAVGADIIENRGKGIGNGE